MNSCRITVVGAVVLAATLVACTGGDDPVPTSPPTTDTLFAAPTSTTPPDLTIGYFDAVAAADATDVATFAAAGSDAARFLLYLDGTTAAVAESGPEGSVPPSGPSTSVGASDATQRVVRTATGFDVCDGATCTTYDSIETDPRTGRLVTMTVDGRPLAGRIAGPGVPDDVDGLAISVVVAYRSNGGRLIVLLRARNLATVAADLFPFAAVYRASVSASGIEATGAWGAASLEVGDDQQMVVAFDDAELGGTMTMSGWFSDGFDLSVEVPVPEP